MPDLKLTYNDEKKKHIYYLNGKRAKGASTVAKIVEDSYKLDLWVKRQVGIGYTLEPNLRENTALDLENDDAINDLCEEAIRIAKAHLKADRGTQKHRVLELVLTDQEHKLLTAQQQNDAIVLKRTLDHYKLTPHDGLVEQFVAWPAYCVTGRFDAVLERPDGELWMTDLKSSENAVLYPQTTAAQLALYARAPHISDGYSGTADKCTVTKWRAAPERLDLHYGRVLLVDNNSDIGTLHRIDIEHGWVAAKLALQLVNWRKEYNYGRDIATPEPEWAQPIAPPTWESLARDAINISELRIIWTRAKECGQLTNELKSLLTQRSNTIGGAA